MTPSAALAEIERLIAAAPPARRRGHAVRPAAAPPEVQRIAARAGLGEPDWKEFWMAVRRLVDAEMAA